MVPPATAPISRPAALSSKAVWTVFKSFIYGGLAFALLNQAVHYIYDYPNSRDIMELSTLIAAAFTTLWCLYRGFHKRKLWK